MLISKAITEVVKLKISDEIPTLIQLLNFIHLQFVVSDVPKSANYMIDLDDGA